MFISIVIAVYNEEKNVKELTMRIYNSLRKLKINFELIYVIDGTDNTYKILKRMQKRHKNLVLLYSSKPTGFANAFKRGFKEVNKSATHIITMDGDLNHQPEEIKHLLEKMDDTGCDIVVGSRYVKKSKIYNMPLWKHMVSFLANKILDLRFNLGVNDKTSGYRLYKRKAIYNLLNNIKCKNFDFLMEILIKAKEKGYKITETPISFKMRLYGQSKFQFFNIMKAYMKLLLTGGA